jgi:hypothetical protein
MPEMALSGKLKAKVEKIVPAFPNTAEIRAVQIQL